MLLEVVTVISRKHYLNLYNERVYEVLDNVLSRDIDKQNNKIQVEIKDEIKNKEEKIEVYKVPQLRSMSKK